MRKKLLVCITVLCMTFGCVVPVFGESVSSDKNVQDAYDAYNAMEVALYADSGDYATMKAEFGELEDASLIIGENDAKKEEWQGIVSSKIGVDKFMDTVRNAVAVMVVVEDEIEGETGLIKAYTDNPDDFGAAYGLANTYDLLVEEGVDMEGMVGSAGVNAYEAAKNDLSGPAALDVIEVYEAYILVEDALFGPYPEDFADAIDAFKDVLDIFNDLDDPMLEDLASLLGVADGDAAYQTVLDDWININVSNKMLTLYDAYMADPGKDTAEEFVEYYDRIYNDPDYEEQGELIDACLEDPEELDEAYEEAKALLNSGAGGGGNEDSNGTAAGGSADEKADAASKSPDTGDNMNVLPFAVIMALAAAGAVAAVRRRA